MASVGTAPLAWSTVALGNSGQRRECKHSDWVWCTILAANSIAIGIGATNTAANQLVIGASARAIQNAYIGNGVTMPSPTELYLACHRRLRHRHAGAAFTLAGGMGTGTGNGGNINFQVAKPGTTGSSLNTLATVASLSGVNGAALFQNSANSTTAFQIQNAAGANIFTADTSGNTITVGSASNVVTISSPGAGTQSEHFGSGSTTGANNNALAVGYGANAHANGVAIGTSANSTSTGGTAIGYSSTAGNYGTALGSSSNAGITSVALGVGATASNTDSIAIGGAATTTASNQLVIGSSTHTIQNAYIGNGVTNAAPANFTLHATGGSGTDIAGAALQLAGGIGTGAGNGGNINFQVAKPGTTGSSLNSLATVASLSGVNGAALFQNSANSTTAFQIQNAAGPANRLHVNTIATAPSGSVQELTPLANPLEVVPTVAHVTWHRNHWLSRAASWRQPTRYLTPLHKNDR